MGIVDLILYNGFLPPSGGEQSVNTLVYVPLRTGGTIDW